mmetsp:Transcript_100308/g.282988  ORF Transcript_100308/g.282988 Transcript_100308/m.282988 type:complete len:287 (-) Transcript_100308:719-1579(-)
MGGREAGHLERRRRGPGPAVRTVLRSEAGCGEGAAVQEGAHEDRARDVQPPARLRPSLPRRQRRRARLPGGHVHVPAAQQGGHQTGRQFSGRGLLALPHDTPGVHQLRGDAEHRRGRRSHTGLPDAPVAGRPAKDQPHRAWRGKDLVETTRAHGQGPGRAACTARGRHPVTGSCAGTCYRSGRASGLGAETAVGEFGHYASAHVLGDTAALVRLQGCLQPASRDGVQRLAEDSCGHRARSQRRPRARAVPGARRGLQPVHQGARCCHAVGSAPRWRTRRGRWSRSR